MLLLTLLTIVLSVGTVAGHTGDGGGHHHNGWMGQGVMDGWMAGGFGFLWMILWTLILIGIPVAAVYLLFTRKDEVGDSDQPDEAMAVLRRRYAEGELDDEEYERRREKLVRGS
ncbi:MAG: SHOCT domain-containing protein [Halobacteria archaeon]